MAFHADDAALLHGLAESVAGGLSAGDAVVVVATPDHCARIAADVADDIDLDHFVAEDCYRDVDAIATLRSIRRDGGIDADAFHRLIGSVVETAAAGGRRVRIVGELVGLMWDEGDVVGALELESLWNDLVRQHEVVLNCAYPADGGSDDLDSLCGICACHSAIDESAEVQPHDDAAEVSVMYVPHRGAAVQARRHVEDALRSWGHDAIVDDAVLLVSEIATNSVIHAKTPFRLTLTSRPGSIRIAVTDGSATMPVRRYPSLDEPGGRGMALVEMIAGESGADAVDGGKVVWAVLAV